MTRNQNIMIQEKGGVCGEEGNERHTSGFTFLYYFMKKVSNTYEVSNDFSLPASRKPIKKIS